MPCNCIILSGHLKACLKITFPAPGADLVEFRGLMITFFVENHDGVPEQSTHLVFDGRAYGGHLRTSSGLDETQSRGIDGSKL